ncbi:hypothetical protein NQX30_03730 [Candidatus Persebacteraceae bacterium Df01]|jgi:hypothetical protein|uniref:NgoFVII family restriction endonuclease n=1 Tax=Candidatus Doriopsillibacter californiensis TaxID=2970740 RepID=A0ABT7QM43_9GAMM|nr:hypothetical protein [Candidatus Persebacteraceae bacterium Df01]
MQFIKSCIRWWQDNRDTSITLKNVLIYAILIALIAFSGGRLHPESDYQQLRDDIEQMRDQIGEFSAQREQDQRKIIKLRATSTLDKKILQQLRDQNTELTKEKIRQQEEVAFYQRILNNEPQTEIAIYTLEDTPDFRPRHHRLSAVLVRAQTKNSFQGTYYFEVVELGARDTLRVTRVPAEASVPLTVGVYEEIEQIFKLPPDTRIHKLRLVIKNKKGEIVAEETTKQE